MSRGDGLSLQLDHADHSALSSLSARVLPGSSPGAPSTTAHIQKRWRELTPHWRSLEISVQHANLILYRYFQKKKNPSTDVSSCEEGPSTSLSKPDPWRMSPGRKASHCPTGQGSWHALWNPPPLGIFASTSHLCDLKKKSFSKFIALFYVLLWGR